jgi:hypothetical protein
MIKFVWAYTDVEAGEEKKFFFNSGCLSQPAWQHLSQGSIITSTISEEVALPVAKS